MFQTRKTFRPCWRGTNGSVIDSRTPRESCDVFGRTVTGDGGERVGGRTDGGDWGPDRHLAPPPPLPRIDDQVQFAKRMVREARICRGERAHSTAITTARQSRHSIVLFHCNQRGSNSATVGRKRKRRTKTRDRVGDGGSSGSVGRKQSVVSAPHQSWIMKRARRTEGVLGRGPGDSRAGGGATHGTENLSEGEIDPQVTS